MGRWIFEVQAEQGHECSPPTTWPFLRRRKHRSGSIWECDLFVPLGTGLRGSPHSNVCGRRWRLEWVRNENPCGADPPAHPEWTEIIPKKPGTPPTGRGGVSPRS
jgi:hypothetical protein